MARRRDPIKDLLPLLRKNRAPWWVILLLIVGVFAFQYYAAQEDAAPPVDTGDPDRTYRVERVVDGDTLVLVGGERVRLLGVDTPETKHPTKPVQPFGPEASAYTTRLAEGATVRLVFDKERRDRYGRLLAYVYIGELFLNEELLRAGLATAELQYPYSSEMKKRFRAAEAEAKAARLGIWSLPAIRAA